MRNFKLVLAYDGSRYRGWQKQGNTDNTIQAKMEALLSRLLEQPVEIAASGRTDAGVHALAQVCSFRADTSLDCGELLKLIRRYLPEDIAALSLTEEEQRFHARLSCREKSYLYRILNSDCANVFERKYVYHYPEKLDISLMEKAAAELVGRHDFTSFCSLKRMKKSAVRTVSAIDIQRVGEEIRIVFTGDGFLYNMVRIMTGTLIEAGRGERDAENVKAALNAKDRERSGFTAPAQGLFLKEVLY